MGTAAASQAQAWKAEVNHALHPERATPKILLNKNLQPTPVCDAEPAEVTLRMDG